MMDPPSLHACLTCSWVRVLQLRSIAAIAAAAAAGTRGIASRGPRAQSKRMKWICLAGWPEVSLDPRKLAGTQGGCNRAVHFSALRQMALTQID